MAHVRLAELTPADVARITQKAALVAAEYERLHGRYLNGDDALTVQLLAVIEVIDEVLDEQR